MKFKPMDADQLARILAAVKAEMQKATDEEEVLEECDEEEYDDTWWDNWHDSRVDD